MGNFQETKFLGLTPKAIGLTLVSVAIVVALFFMPEGVKLLFDGKLGEGKARTKREAPQAKSPQAQNSAQQNTGGDRDVRAALSRSALESDAPKISRTSSSETARDQKLKEVRAPQRRAVGEETLDIPKVPSNKGGILSGWDFSVKARRSMSDNVVEEPKSLPFEKIVSKEGINFLKQGRGAIPQFLKSESLSISLVEDSIEPLEREIDSVVAGTASSTENPQETANRLRMAHVAALRGLIAAGADRGVLLRWLDVPVIRFIDKQGGVKATRRIRDAFQPRMTLVDVTVRQRVRGGWGSNGQEPAYISGEMSVFSSDVQKIVIFANGKMINSYNLAYGAPGEPRSVRIDGDASGVWTFVAYDTFGARPYSKSYSFYPKASIFRQDSEGKFQIAFLPGSARNSLDRFFLVGTSARRQLQSDASFAMF
jgi:hypothetical protein